jgi:23S rRNA (cytidine1920-2'-O)/16S rRNA (cytidine1409-2'-O)-methyltransferase
MKMDAAPVRADLLLVRRGLAASRERARSMIAGGLVSVDGVVMTRPARRLAAAADVTVSAPDMAWVSRAALKLIGGLDAFPQIDPSGLHCVDIGASTGGFTEVLLSRGAAHVVAVDVGHGQIHPRLADDPRVESREGVNARSLTANDFTTPPELIVCDASFISLAKVLPAVMRVSAPGAGLLALIKPQFEVGRAAIGKGGVVRDAKAARDAVAMVENWLAADMGWQMIGTTPSGISAGRS